MRVNMFRLPFVSIYLSLCLSLFISVYLSINFYIYIYIYIYIYFFIHHHQVQKKTISWGEYLGVLLAGIGVVATLIHAPWNAVASDNPLFGDFLYVVLVLL